MDASNPKGTRNFIARAFTLVEDVVYVGLGVLLGSSAALLLVLSLIAFVKSVAAGSLPSSIVSLLDQSLLVLLIVELLYTLQVSFREHRVVPEPFLLVGLIAAIRRVLLLTAQFSELKEESAATFQHFALELGILTVLIVALTGSLVLLHQKGVSAAAERA
ncbi:MAG TPA: phosphate-starvation-inducible PsiE family protein [Thermoanaerobaculia bacterium]|nr:phosphate-starvation-inducible PsiE family protein [Thermoanaerobaculia bacterium]